MQQWDGKSGSSKPKKVVNVAVIDSNLRNDLHDHTCIYTYVPNLQIILIYHFTLALNYSKEQLTTTSSGLYPLQSECNIHANKKYTIGLQQKAVVAS